MKTMTSSCIEPGGVRTHDLLLRRETLYPAELRAQSSVIVRQRASLCQGDVIEII